MSGETAADNAPQCAYCRYWKQGACDAFPGGVPYLILANKVDHRQPFPLDRHIQFRPYSLEADEKQRALVAPLYVAAKQPSLVSRLLARLR